MTVKNKPSTPGIRKRLLKDGSRDAEVSQQAILLAATAEFSQHGLKGARVDQIAAAAGINKQLLYRYFGNKDDLYLRVLEDVYYRFREDEMALALETLSPVKAIRMFIASMVERVHSQPHFARLVIDENFHEGRHLKHSDRVRELHAEMLARIEKLLKRGVRDGEFRKGVNAVQLFASIASLSTFYVTNTHTLTAIFGDRFETLQETSTITAHIEQMVLSFIFFDPTVQIKTLAKRSLPR